MSPNNQQDTTHNKNGDVGEGKPISHTTPPPPQKNLKNQQNTKKNIKNIKSKKSTIISCNIRGLVPGLRRDKLTYLCTIADQLNTNFLMLTESHLSESVTEAETFLPGWQNIRSDRKSRQKGGAIIYVRDQFTIEDTLTFSNDYVEIICTFIPAQDLALITLYRPPATPASKFFRSFRSC